MAVARSAEAGYADVAELAPVIRRVVAARVSDPETVGDLVQETLTRLLTVRPRLSDEALTPYAVVTARNLIRSMARSQGTAQRHLHRLVDLREPSSPAEEALRREEAEAVSVALGTLRPRDRDTLIAHEIEGVDTAALADSLDSTPGAVAVSMARTRSKLRVEYLLALHRAQLPTARCRPVLLALSAGDRRRQLAVGAGAHLLECDCCAELSEPLLRGRTPAVALLLPLGLVRLAGRLRAFGRDHPVQASLTTAGVTVAAVAAVAALAPAAGDGPAPAAAPATAAGSEPAAVDREETRPATGGPLRVGPRRIAALSRPGALAEHIGRPVVAEDVPVQSVVSDEGFWVGDDAGRIFVQLRAAGESRVRVRPGQRLSFRGAVVATPERLPRTLGRGIGRLRDQAAHLEAAEVSVQANR